MNQPDVAVSALAAVIGEPARARMLYSLMDGQARSSTDLAALAGVSPSTASAHLGRLRSASLVRMLPHGKYRYYCLEQRPVAEALEALAVLAVGSVDKLKERVPSYLREARTCYDHIAGRLAILLHDRFRALGWLSTELRDGRDVYDLTPEGTKAFSALGIDLVGARARRRQFAYGCIDWSERRPHLAGALGAALLVAMRKHKWVREELDNRVLNITRLGHSELKRRLGISL